jgi:exonuclease SbcC
MSNYKGSFWSKWDLHVHTPCSIVSHYGGDWEKFISDIEALPKEFSVIGINDYIFLDGYRRVVEEHQKGRMQNISLFLPVIELRIDKFGGTNNYLSRVNFHVIFDNTITADQIEQQFLAALGRSYKVTPQYLDLTTTQGWNWNALPTRDSLEDLGRLIIESVPEVERINFSAPLVEGFNNFNVTIDAIYEALNNSYFCGKYLTAVGKTEWANVRWNNQSIAEKKSIINMTDMVFISTESPEQYTNAKRSLVNAAVNPTLLDCSDAHRFSDSDDKDRIGKCFTWIKSDPTFEGLKQALYDFEHRIKIAVDVPVIPPLRIESISFNFPEDTLLKGREIQDEFCYRGAHEISVSPYLTSVIGGRGTGKSTFLNLLQEKAKPGDSLFFRENKLSAVTGDSSISTCVDIDSTVELSEIEFLSQNSIEDFAMNSRGFRDSIFSRLFKLNAGSGLREKFDACMIRYGSLGVKLRSVGEKYELSRSKIKKENELEANEKLVDSFGSDEYKFLNTDLSIANEKHQSVLAWKKRLNDFLTDIDQLLSKYSYELPAEPNPYSVQFVELLAALNTLVPVADEKEGDAEAKDDLPQFEAAIAKEKDNKQRLLDDYLNKKGLSKENLIDVSNASKRISELKEEIPQITHQIELVEKKISKISGEENPKPIYEQAISQALHSINDSLENLSAEVRPITMAYKWDTDSFENAIVEYLHKELAAIKDKPPRADRLKTELEEIDFQTIPAKDEFLSFFNGNKQVTKDLFDYFAEDENYYKFLVAIELESQNCSEHTSIAITYDDRPIQDTSFGQRCTAAIVVLIMLGNTPLVIDEPEAHLDSSLIAKYLVELVKIVKVNRQLIFATHNANFVINGDSELIHILEIDEDKKSVRSSTSIENLEYRERLLSLEGGIEAFKKREQRYG